MVSQEIDDRMVALAAGASLDYAGYRQQVGYIEALNAVLKHCHEIELDRYGKRPGSAQGGG